MVEVSEVVRGELVGKLSCGEGEMAENLVQFAGDGHASWHSIALALEQLKIIDTYRSDDRARPS